MNLHKTNNLTKDTFVFKHPEVAPSIVRDGKSTAELRKQNKLVFYRFRFSLPWKFVAVVKESSMFVCDVVSQVVRSFHIFQSIPQDEIVVDHIVHMGQGPLRRHLMRLARWSRYSDRFTDRACPATWSWQLRRCLFWLLADPTTSRPFRFSAAAQLYVGVNTQHGMIVVHTPYTWSSCALP